MKRKTACISTSPNLFQNNYIEESLKADTADQTLSDIESAGKLCDAQPELSTIEEVDEDPEQRQVSAFKCNNWQNLELLRKRAKTFEVIKSAYL